MFRNLLTPQNRYALVALTGTMLLVGIFLFLILYSRFQPRETPITPFPSPTTVELLTQRERKYPEAITQPFYSDNSGRTGTLIVTSPLSDVRIKIDSGDEEVPVSPVSYPRQRPPFKISNMPSGKHLLQAVMPGYVMQNITVEIKPNQTTRVTINLQPIRTVE